MIVDDINTQRAPKGSKQKSEKKLNVTTVTRILKDRSNIDIKSVVSVYSKTLGRAFVFDLSYTGESNELTGDYYLVLGLNEKRAILFNKNNLQDSQHVSIEHGHYKLGRTAHDLVRRYYPSHLELDDKTLAKLGVERR